VECCHKNINVEPDQLSRNCLSWFSRFITGTL
jgi:hypothetical protein